VKVLIVEDDADIRELVSFKLEQAGISATYACDGEAGLEAALRERPDVVLLDHMMPKLSGIEVVERLRQDPSMNSTWVILMTAKAQEADVERGYAAGADDYIVKPFSPRDLIAKVQMVTRPSN